jgi:hypothetical protein
MTTGFVFILIGIVCVIWIGKEFVKCIAAVSRSTINDIVAEAREQSRDPDNPCSGKNNKPDTESNIL